MSKRIRNTEMLAMKNFSEAIMAIPNDIITPALEDLIYKVESGHASIATIRATTEAIWNRYTEMEYASQEIIVTEVASDEEVFEELFPELIDEVFEDWRITSVSVSRK